MTMHSLHVIKYKTLGTVMDSSFDVQVENLQKVGATIRLLDYKEVDAFQTASKYREVQAAWVKEQEAKGLNDASSVLEKVTAIINEVMK